MNDYNKLLKEYERFKLALDASNVGLFDLTPETNAVYYSAGWKEIIGYKDDEFPNDVQAFIKNIDKESYKKCIKMNDAVLADTESEFSFNIIMQHKKGYKVHILVRARAFIEPEKNTHRIIGTHTDISDLKDTEIQLKMKQDELEEILFKNERQRKANLVILNDLNKTTKKLMDEIEAHKESHKQLILLSHHLQNAREEQSAYLAREIHDDLGQELTALEMLLTLLEDALSVDKSTSENILSLHNELRAQLNSVVEKSRKLTVDLRPVILDSYNIAEAIIWLSRQFEKNSRIKVDVDIERNDFDLGDKYNLAVFRVFQEALNNIAKHSGANSVSIVIKKNKDVLFFSISDNGCGFDVEEDQKKISYGLMNMKERVMFCEGIFEIRSKKGDGTGISFSIPISEI
jgi:two-component system sensor histidine kinase UhpB